ncbi:MAG: hypothetical protein U1E39_15390 [Planctomycetota bacterium]
MRARAGLAGCLGLAAVLAAGLPVRAAPAAPSRLEVRRARIDGLDAQLTALVARAGEDPRIARVDGYLALSRAEDFAASRRTRVADLAEFLADDDAPPKLKERVRDALKSIPHRSLDPDLFPGEGRNKRLAFCRDKLLPLLVRPGEKALLTRTLVAEILESFWRFTDSAIQRYDPKDDSTWKKAADAYRRGMSGAR